MKGRNLVVIVGTLGNDPEMRYLPSGEAVCNMSLATSESWKDRNTGEKRENTDWHRVVIFGKLATIAGEYLKKGSKVYIEGKLKNRKWKDNQGVERYSTEVVVQGYNGIMQMLGNPSSSGNQPNQGYNQSHQPKQEQQQNQSHLPKQGQQQSYSDDYDSQDWDIPF